MKKHEITFLLGIGIGWLLARPIVVNNMNGNSNSTLKNSVDTKAIGNENKG